MSCFSRPARCRRPVRPRWCCNRAFGPRRRASGFARSPSTGSPSRSPGRIVGRILPDRFSHAQLSASGAPAGSGVELVLRPVRRHRRVPSRPWRAGGDRRAAVPFRGDGARRDPTLDAGRVAADRLRDDQQVHRQLGPRSRPLPAAGAGADERSQRDHQGQGRIASAVRAEDLRCSPRPRAGRRQRGDLRANAGRRDDPPAAGRMRQDPVRGRQQPAAAVAGTQSASRLHLRPGNASTLLQPIPPPTGNLPDRTSHPRPPAVARAGIAWHAATASFRPVGSWP